jgi:hypothetical protein
MTKSNAVLGTLLRTACPLRSCIYALFICAKFATTLHRHPSLLRQLPQYPNIKRVWLTHPTITVSNAQHSSPNQLQNHIPSSPLTMIPQIIPCVRMNQCTQRPPPNHQPTHKSPKLLRREHIDLKHADRMRSKRSLEHRINS